MLTNRSRFTFSSSSWRPRVEDEELRRTHVATGSDEVQDTISQECARMIAYWFVTLASARKAISDPESWTKPRPRGEASIRGFEVTGISRMGKSPSTIGEVRLGW